MRADWLRQNDTDALTAIAAADTLWGQVQLLRLGQLNVIVGLPVVLALASQRLPALSLLASYVGLAMLLIDVGFLNWWIIVRRREAAQAQDLFDAISFSFVRSDKRIANDMDISRLLELAKAQPAPRAERNRDWYTPALQSLPSGVGRLACMRESATWDSTLRTRWSNAVIVSTTAAFAGFITWAVFSHQPTDVFLQSIAVPLSPAIAWAIREFREQRDSAKTVASIHSKLRELWEQAISGSLVEPELSATAVEISSKFLEYRASTSPVPHAIYGLFRDKQATSAKETAAALIRDYDRRVLS